MKKLLCLLSTSLIMLTSCSGDDPVPSNSSDVLLKRQVQTYNGTVESEATYIYNSNKLIKVVYGAGDYEDITYSGDLITKIESKLSNGTLNVLTTYEYNTSNQLVLYKSLDYTYNEGNKETYVYNTNGTVTITGYTGNTTAQTDLNETTIVSFLNDEVSQVINSSEGNTITYTYDNKNNPFKNVLGYAKVSFAGGDSQGIFHNVITENDSEFGMFNYSYIYNSDNYPTAKTQGAGSEVTTTQYFYE